MVTALNVGNSILVRAFAENIDTTPMKLQKLIYFVYRDYLQKTKQRLFEERFETWKYGPVLPSVYNEFKKYGSNAIREFAYEKDGKTVYTVDEGSAPIFKQVINSVWETCKGYDGIYLSSITHQKGSAWSKAAEAESNFLTDEDILEEVIPIG